MKVTHAYGFEDIACHPKLLKDGWINVAYWHCAIARCINCINQPNALQFTIPKNYFEK